MIELQRHDLNLDELAYHFDDLFTDLRRLAISSIFTTVAACAFVSDPEFSELHPFWASLCILIWAAVFAASVVALRRGFAYRVASAERLLSFLRKTVFVVLVLSVPAIMLSPAIFLTAVTGLWTHYVIRSCRRTAALLADSVSFADGVPYRAREAAFFDAKHERRTPLNRVRFDRLILMLLTIAVALSTAMVSGVIEQASAVLIALANLALFGSALGFPVIRTARRFLRGPLDEAALAGVDTTLLLRSFQDDARMLQSASFWAKMALWRKKLRLEESVVQVLERRAPVIAIGEPGERLPQLGAVRAYPTHDEWRRKALGWARDATAIVMIAGKTPGVSWELRNIVANLYDSKTLILFRPEGGVLRRSRLEHIRRGLSDAHWIEALAEIEPEHLIGVFMRGPHDVVVLHGLGFHQSYYDLACILATTSFGADTTDLPAIINRIE